MLWANLNMRYQKTVFVIGQIIVSTFCIKFNWCLGAHLASKLSVFETTKSMFKRGNCFWAKCFSISISVELLHYNHSNVELILCIVRLFLLKMKIGIKCILFPEKIVMCHFFHLMSTKYSSVMVEHFRSTYSLPPIQDNRSCDTGYILLHLYNMNSVICLIFHRFFSSAWVNLEIFQSLFKL